MDLIGAVIGYWLWRSLLLTLSNLLTPLRLRMHLLWNTPSRLMWFSFNVQTWHPYSSCGMTITLYKLILVVVLMSRADQILRVCSCQAPAALEMRREISASRRCLSLLGVLNMLPRYRKVVVVCISWLFPLWGCGRVVVWGVASCVGCPRGCISVLSKLMVRARSEHMDCRCASMVVRSVCESDISTMSSAYRSRGRMMVVKSAVVGCVWSTPFIL